MKETEFRAGIRDSKTPSGKEVVPAANSTTIIEFFWGSGESMLIHRVRSSNFPIISTKWP